MHSHAPPSLPLYFVCVWRPIKSEILAPKHHVAYIYTRCCDTCGGGGAAEDSSPPKRQTLLPFPIADRTVSSIYPYDQPTRGARGQTGRHTHHIKQSQSVKVMETARESEKRSFLPPNQRKSALLFFSSSVTSFFYTLTLFVLPFPPSHSRVHLLLITSSPLANNSHICHWHPASKKRRKKDSESCIIF